MARRIEGTIFRLTYTATWNDYVECSSIEDLFKYIAQEYINGQIVTSVNEVCKDGKTPKIKVFTDSNFKKNIKRNEKVNVIKHYFYEKENYKNVNFYKV